MTTDWLILFLRWLGVPVKQRTTREAIEWMEEQQGMGSLWRHLSGRVKR